MDALELVLAALGGGGLVAVINQWLDRRAQRIREEARALREVRAPLYRELLRPWAVTLAAAREGRDPVQALAGSADSPEYHRALFEFAMTASDDLVRSFGRMMLAASLSAALPEEAKNNIEDPRTLMADFVFHLRKDLGPRNTRLEPDDLIRVLLPSSGNADITEILRDDPERPTGASSAVAEA